MKKLIIFITLFIGGTAYAQLPLECPPCASFKSCGKCWESAEAAQQNGCNSSSRLVDLGQNSTMIDEGHFVYPNPSNDGLFTFKSSKIFEGKVMIYSTSGHLLEGFDLKNTTFFQSTTTLPPGIYVIKYLDADGGTGIKKLMVNP